MPTEPAARQNFWAVLLSRWKVLIGLVGGSLLPWLSGLLRDWLAQAGIEWAWGIANPKVAVVLNWMASNPILSAVMGAVVWLLVMATASHLRVRAATNPPGKPEPSDDEPLGNSPKPEERIFIPESATDVLAVPPGATGVQIQRSKAMYVGKWLRVRGAIGTLMPFDSFYQLTLRGDLALSAYFYFGLEWGNRLEHLKPGQVVTLVGRVEQIDAVPTLHLEQCELESVATADAHVQREQELKERGVSYQSGHWQAEHAESLVKSQPTESPRQHFAPVPAIPANELRFFGGPRVEMRHVSWGGSLAITSQLCACVLVDVESCKPAFEAIGVMAKLIAEGGRNNVSVPAAVWLDKNGPRFRLKPFAHATLIVAIRPHGYKEMLQLLRDNRDPQLGILGLEHVVIAGTEPGTYHRVRVEVFTQNGKQLSHICEIITKEDGVRAQWDGEVPNG